MDDIWNIYSRDAIHALKAWRNSITAHTLVDADRLAGGNKDRHVFVANKASLEEQRKGFFAQFLPWVVAQKGDLCLKFL